MAIYVITLGYDERFAVRFLLRHSVGEGDSVIVVVPRGYEGDEKARTAVNNLKKLVEGLEICEFDPSDALSEITKMTSFLKEKSEGSRTLHLCLSGGMRIIVISTLLASQLLAREVPREIWVEVDLEDLSGTVRIPLNALLIPRNERFLKILEALSQDVKRPSVRYVESVTSIPSATVHREMGRMISLGLITKDYKITDFGRAYLLIHTEKAGKGRHTKTP